MNTKRTSNPSPRLASLATPLPQGERGNRLLVARIGAPHGVRGDVKLWSFTADPAAVADYGPFETADGKRIFEIETIRPQKDFFVTRFKSVPDRNVAETLTNTDLYVPRDRLPETDDPDEFYHTDLIGLTAVDRVGAPFGKVVAMMNYGAGDLIEILPDASSTTLLLPFDEATVPEIDIAGGKIVVVPPEEVSGDESRAPPSPPLPRKGGGSIPE